MRIIAGRLKGRRLVAPKGSQVRPTSDSLRETLFNVLGPTLDGMTVLDGFAGTGALGIEALSRGAARVTFVESDRRVIDTLERNIRALDVEDACAIIRDDFVSGRWASGTFDLVLLDPPYDIRDLEAVTLAGGSAVGPGGQLVLEHSRRRASPESAGTLRRTRVLTAGDSALSFYT